MEMHYTFCIQAFDDPDYEEPQYLGFVEEFSMCECSFIGDTWEETYTELKGVLEDVIAFYKEEGKELPKPTKRTFLEV